MIAFGEGYLSTMGEFSGIYVNDKRQFFLAISNAVIAYLFSVRFGS